MKIEKDRREFFCRPTPESDWRRVDDLVKQPGLRFDQRAADRLDRVADIHSIGPDGDTLYISTRLGTDRFELAAFSMSEGVIKKTIARHPRFDLTEDDGGLARLLFAKNSSQLLGLVFEAQKPQVVWLAPHYQAVQKAMDRNFPEHINFPVDWSQDGLTLIYWSTNDRDPGSYHVFRVTENQLIPVLQLGEHLKDRGLAHTTSMEFPTRDGQQISGYVTRPPKQPGLAPLLVHVHGGPMARDSWRFDATNQFFATRGYIVLQVNYRGSSGFGAAYQNAGLLARLDTVVIDDIADAAQHLIAKGEVDASRVAIMGASFGGWATYISLAKYPDLYRAGIAVAAVSNWRKTLRDDRWRFDNQVAFRFWKTLLERENFKTDEPFIDPLLRNGEIKQPVFIIHGERDAIVHATEAREMLNALRKHNPNVQAKSFPRAGHGNWTSDERVIYLNEVGAFLDQHLLRTAEFATPSASSP
jgi:dienelactone hydrolase